MKKFTVTCDFQGQKAPFSVYIGVPEKGHHPLHFQGDWLGKNRGGSISPEIMDSVGRLQEIANRNNVLLEDLCVYALGAAQQEKDAGVNEEPLPEGVEPDDYHEEDSIMIPNEAGNLDIGNVEAQDEEVDDSFLDELLNELKEEGQSIEERDTKETLPQLEKNENSA